MTRSLSNLYKPWFVHTESQNTRVIDSNDDIQEFLKQQMVKQDRPVGPDGFAEGIIRLVEEYLEKDASKPK